MIKRLRLKNYRSFRDFTVEFSGSACLVGPNNAGKSTVLTAFRLVDVLLRIAHARRPLDRVVYENAGYQCYAVPLSEFQSLAHSLRHEFTTAEASLELTWQNGNRLFAFWPEVDAIEPGVEPEGYFFLQKDNKQQPRDVVDARLEFPRLGIVPVLSPLEQTETVLSEEYVRRNVSTRLSSRHFRNQLVQLERANGMEEFKEFVTSWLPGVMIRELETYESAEGEYSIDLFLQEAGGRVPKEVIWAGDGIQVWLQILYHLHRLRGYGTVILDEPDVYLHADLQRRLVQLLESTESQTIVATHSAEIVAEYPRASMIWIDKSRKRGISIKNEALLDKLTGTLGSSFNLKIAKAMRSKVLLMVEGKDMQILRRLSQALNANRLAKQEGISVVPLEGYSNSEHLASLKWILSDFLNGAVECYVLLDSDYRPGEVSRELEAQFHSIGVHAHVWRRKELESYLIEPSVISRISGASEVEVQQILSDAAATFEDFVFSRMLEEKIAFERSATNHRVTVTEKFKPDFQKRWTDSQWRLGVAPPKRLLSMLNTKLQAAKYKTVSAERIAAAMARDEIPAEMRAALLQVERAAESA
nr:ATP-binding protein [Micromonospora costi]